MKMVHGVYWDGIFHGRFENAAASKKIFLDWVETVKSTVPSGSLLVFDVRSGWPPLCAFLGVLIPEQRPFPHKNAGLSVRIVVLMLTLLRFLPYVLVASLLIWGSIKLLA